MIHTINVPQLAWHGVKDLELQLPEKWQIEICNMSGYKRPALNAEAIRAAVKNPMGCLPIREGARNKKQAVIIFDDIQRGTRVADIVPLVLEELAEAGVEEKNIQFIAATGCHAAMNRLDFAKKLGEDVIRRFPVYSHNAFGSCTDIGTTSHGTRLLVNAEVMACDYKIAIGSVVPHAFAGFGGGAKIILPGICHYQTCLDFHKAGSLQVLKEKDKPVGVGVLEDNVLRSDMEEAAEMVGLDIKIDTLMNSRGETAAVYAGSLKAAYPEAVKDARKHYDTVMARDQDIIIANTYAKAAESECGFEIAFPSVRKEGGVVVVIGNVPEGHVEHYLAGAWGKNTRGNFQMECAIPPNVKKLILYTEYPDLTFYGYFAEPEKVSIIDRWGKVLEDLQKRYPGEAKVAVYPNADIQYSSAHTGSAALSFVSRD